jgi:hypothetical protein
MRLPAASWKVFWYTWCARAESHLKFRGKSQHGKCDVCEDFAQHLKQALTTAEKVQTSCAWDKHLRDTFRDRRFYYAINDMSNRFWHLLDVSYSTAGFIIDGMDQAKFRCPRMAGRTCHPPSIFPGPSIGTAGSPRGHTFHSFNIRFPEDGGGCLRSGIWV